MSQSSSDLALIFGTCFSISFSTCNSEKLRVEKTTGTKSSGVYLSKVMRMIKTTTNSWPDIRSVFVGGTHRIYKGFTPVCDFFLQILTLRQSQKPSLETFRASFLSELRHRRHCRHRRTFSLILSSNRNQISRANSFTPLIEVAIGCVDEIVCFISHVRCFSSPLSPTDSKSNTSFSCSNSLSYLMKGAQKPRKISGAASIDWQKKHMILPTKLFKLIYQVFVFDSPFTFQHFSKSPDWNHFSDTWKM